MKHSPNVDTGLDLIFLLIREAERKRIEFLFDTGATISLIKLKTLKNEAVIHEEKIKLTGITGHSLETIEKAYLHVKLNNGKIRHPVYVIKDDTPLEYDGIIGADFIRKNSVTCDYGTKRIRIGDTSFKLNPYKRVKLKSRSETIVQVIANVNIIGVTRSEETAPGIFIGS